MTNRKRAVRVGVLFILLAVVITVGAVLNRFNLPNYTAKEVKGAVLLLDLGFLLSGLHLLARRRQRFALELVVFVWISLVLGVVTVELGCRFYLFGWDCLNFSKMNSVYSTQGSSQPGIYQRSEFPELIIEFKPDLDTYFHLKRFQTNSAGLRDREYSVEKPKGVVRIAVVGDSLTAGWGVEQEKTFAKVLEQRANAELEGKYEFINFGHSGYGLSQYMVVMEKKVLGYDPDIVLIGFCGNDDEIIEQEQIDNPIPVRARNNPIFRLFMLDMIKTSKAYRSFVHRNDAGPLDTELARRRENGEKWFREFKRFSDKNGIPVVIVELYVPGAKGTFAREFAEKCELGYVSTKEYFGDEGFNYYAIYPIDGHPNDRANAVYAEAVFDYLNKKK